MFKIVIIMIIIFKIELKNLNWTQDLNFTFNIYI